MNYSESRLVCALRSSREEAEAAVASLAEQGIEAQVGELGARYHDLPAGMWEVRVPMGQAARARVLLSEPDSG
jgi:hypothetical protein